MADIPSLVDPAPEDNPEPGFIAGPPTPFAKAGLLTDYQMQIVADHKTHEDAAAEIRAQIEGEGFASLTLAEQDALWGRLSILDVQIEAERKLIDEF